MVSDPERSGRARQAGRLMLAAGLFTVVNNYLPGAGQLDVTVLNLVGLGAAAIGLLAYVLPWHRWPGNATLVFPPVAFALISVANRFGGVSDFSYGVYFVLAFTWVGLAFPPRTGLVLAPLATAAYVLPGLTTADGPAGSVSSVTVVIPVCLLVAETIARTMQKVTAAAAETHRHETALREAEQRFRLAFENAAIGMALVGLDGRWLRVNRAVCEIVGYPVEDLLTKTFQDITHPDDLELDLRHLGQMLAGETKTYSMEKRYFHADGHVVWINLSVSLVRDEDDAPWYFISQIEDVTERKRAEDALLASEERTRRILETAGDAFVSMDHTGQITAWNRQAEVAFGWPAEAILGRSLEEVLVPPDRRAQFRRGLDRFLATGEASILGRRLEATLLHRNGHEIHVESVIWALREGDGWSFNGFLRDISARKALEGELQRLALVDELTGLRNRRGFLAAADPLTRVAQRNLRDMALIYIDVDNMKDINDRHGHSSGDRALVETADLLRGTFRESDVIARLGGDEFCVLVPDDGIETKVAIHRLEERLDARRAVGADPVISLSLGIAKYHWEAPCPVDTLIDRADAAMYEMKNERRALRR